MNEKPPTIPQLQRAMEDLQSQIDELRENQESLEFEVMKTKRQNRALKSNNSDLESRISDTERKQKRSS